MAYLNSCFSFSAGSLVYMKMFWVFILAADEPPFSFPFLCRNSLLVIGTVYIVHASFVGWLVEIHVKRMMIII